MRTIVITNRKLCSIDFFERIQELSEKAWAVVLREKDLSANEYSKLFEKCRKITPVTGNTFYNEVKDLHGGSFQFSYSVFNEKGRMGFENVGVSVHSIDEAKNSEILGADYIIAGHIFATDCKRGIPPRGLSFLSEICKNVSIPVFAIGGITNKNAGEAVKAGAFGVCVMSGAMNGSFDLYGD